MNAKISDYPPNDEKLANESNVDSTYLNQGNPEHHVELTQSKPSDSDHLQCASLNNSQGCSGKSSLESEASSEICDESQINSQGYLNSDSNTAFFDSNGIVHANQGFSYFDALEVLYFDDMLHQFQNPLSKSHLDDDESGLTSPKPPSEDEATTPRKKSLVKDIKGRVDANQKKLRELARNQRNKLERTIHARRRKLKKLISDPGFVMTMDKVSFVLGVLTIMIIELVLLTAPEKMGSLYTILLVPLMIARYFIYRAGQYHYFMYDFCYFAQVLLLVHIYAYPENNQLGRALFSVSNGPIALAVVMWRNSLVFHSMDKMTSMFIHVLPPLVMFSRRWGSYISERKFPFYEKFEGTCSGIIVDFWFNPFCLYALWQAIYLIKTEVISKKKLRHNTDIMTSLRWLTRKRDSASFRLLSYFGEGNQLPTFVFVQAVYTICTFLLVPFLYHSIWLHSLYLLAIFVAALANGATYYFHVFAVRYIEEIGKKVSDESPTSTENSTN